MDSQSKQVSEYATRMEDYDKKFEENSRRFGSMLAVSGKNVLYLVGKIIFKVITCIIVTFTGTQQMQNRVTILSVTVPPDAGNDY